MKGKTAFVIAHRRSTLANADHNVVIDIGQIVELRTCESLLQITGECAKSPAMQFGLHNARLKPIEVVNQSCGL